MLFAAEIINNILRKATSQIANAEISPVKKNI